VFRHHGVEDFRGIDGEYVEAGRLMIPEQHFAAANLEMGFSIDRAFDLALCLEVAEHLPGSCASGLVRSLVNHAPYVLFSGSIPYQDGTRHINEQWPSYWVELFSNEGYVAIDCVRHRFWSDSRVRWWFAQNTILYCDPAVARENPRVLEYMCASRGTPPHLVHPELLLHKENRLRALQSDLNSPRWLLRRLVSVVLARLQRR
jgi:hypothetical protein